MAKKGIFKLRDDDYGDRKIVLKFDISMLNMLIGYLFKKSTQVTRKSMSNMKKLFDMIDDNIYDGNDQMESRFYFINRVLKARLELGFENEDAITNYCRTDNFDKEIEVIIKNLDSYKRINFEEIKFVNKAIQERLRYAYLFFIKDKMYSTIEKLDSGDYDSFQEINDELVALSSKVLNYSRKVNVLDDVDTISLSDEDYDDKIADIVNRIKDPSRILKTGIQKLNQILAPGFMSKRLYLFLGLPAGFKSGILLKTARDIKKYNRGIQVKKAGKRPCVLLVTMENTIEESIERLFNMTVTGDDIRNYTAKQVIKMLKEDGELVLKDENDIDIVIKYYPNRSISTQDLYTIIEELSDENKEVVALILDYIKRIRPYEHGKDEKEELKNVTNELKNLAIDLDIPVISAHQLNREGAKAVDSAMTANKEDLARFVGRGNVGSAWEVQENADWACIINVEKKKGTDQYFLTFKRIKIRYRDPHDLAYFNHPFVVGNRMMLQDDIYLDHSLSEESFASDFEGVIDLNSVKKGKRTAVDRETIKDSAEDIFDFSAAINRAS